MEEKPIQQIPQPQYIEYTTKRGDTLSAIAKRYGTTVAEIVKLNNIKNLKRIYEGRTLRIPNSQATQEVQPDTPTDNDNPQNNVNGKTERLPGGTVITIKDGKVVDAKYPEGDNTYTDERTGIKTVYKNGNIIRSIYPDGTVHVYAQISKPRLGKNITMSIITINPDGPFIKAMGIDEMIENAGANGKLDGTFTQGDAGDCWLLAGLDSIARKPAGKAYLESLLRVNSDGSVTVRLPGAGRTYTISAEELENANYLSSGDLDFRAFEIAMDKYFKEIGETGNSDSQYNNGTNINGNFAEKLYKAIFGGGFNYNFSGPDSYYNVNKFNNKKRAYTISLCKNTGGAPRIANHSECGDRLELEHAYSVLKADSQYVYLVDPHNSKNVIKVSIEEFRKYDIYIESVAIP